MVWNLLKKDCLIIRKYLIFLLALVIALFILFSFVIQGRTGLGVFLTPAFVVQMVAFNLLSTVESKYPKGAALLCTAPYSRRAMVGATYLFHLGIFLYCYVVYTVVAVCVPPHNTGLSLLEIGTYALMVSVTYGIYIPMIYKFGYVKTRFLSIILILIISSGMPLITSKTGLLQWMTTQPISLGVLPNYVWGLFALILAVLIFGASMMVSMKIYEKKEL